MLQGNIQKLRIVSWDALPRVDETINFAWKPGAWYHLKLTVDVQDKQAVIKGKAGQMAADFATCIRTRLEAAA